MKYHSFYLSLFLILLSATAQASPYDVNYFLKNQDDIKEQLDICRIKIWKAKENGNLADVKAAKNAPACLAAKEAKKQIKERREAKDNQQYLQRKKASAQLSSEITALAKRHSLVVLTKKKERCDDTAHPVLGRSGSMCAKISRAIYQRKELDKLQGVENYRTKSGRLSEKERFILLSRPGRCIKVHERETCQSIRRAQYLDEEAYRKVFSKNRQSAQAMINKCKPAFFAALKKARAIKNSGDRMRAESAVVNLYKPPFNNPLACKTAATTLNTSFGMMAYEKK